MTSPLMSIVIPTFNRRESLLCTLDSLCYQSLSANQFEVIVVDDGGSDGVQDTAQMTFPFKLRYQWQINQGGVIARNRGAEIAQGDLLVFLDDDMTAKFDYLAGLASVASHQDQVLLRGQLEPWNGYTSVFARSSEGSLAHSRVTAGEFSSNNLALRRDGFFTLGGWKDVLPGICEHRGGIWSDLEFAVRANQAGYRLITVENAHVVHRDYAATSLEIAYQRSYMVSKLAVPVIKSYPGLMVHMPMFCDKGPIAWRQDPLRLILRKLTRQVMSSRLSMWIMQHAVPFLERRAPESATLALLYRWIVSGFIFRGYRDGLREQVE